MVNKLIDSSYLERIERLQTLNQKLVDVLSQTGYELIQYARKHDIELPYKIVPLLEQAKKYIKDLKSPTSINKKCYACGKLNIENADFCCYCGSSLIITRIRQQDKSPVNAPECGISSCSEGPYQGLKNDNRDLVKQDNTRGIN